MNINDRSGLVLLHSPAAFAPAGHGHDIAAAIERPQSCPECGLLTAGAFTFRSRRFREARYDSV